MTYARLKNPERKNMKLIIYSLLMIMAGISCRWYFKTTTDHFEAKKNSDAIQRGKNLTFTICAGCHYEPKVGQFIGKSLNDLPKIVGHLYAANLTQSKTHGIPPQYTDAELFYLLKTGIPKVESLCLL
jgi:mono/diheme cytochrome c family protein